MKIIIPQLYFSKILRAIVEFELIDDGDSIMIGLSGGKDSLFLTYVLALMRERLKKNFTLQAVTVNPLFSADFNVQALTDFCNTLDISHKTVEVDIAESIRQQDGKDPCYTCAFLRRAAVNRSALEAGCRKVAYAHHHDDAVETFFMSLLHSGQLQTFTPKTYLDRTGITVIRPLVYMREEEIVEAQSLLSISPIPSPCPYDGNTARQKIKELIAELSKDNPLLYEHLASAMREESVKQLWPRAKTRKEMKDTYIAYMKD